MSDFLANPVDAYRRHTPLSTLADKLSAARQARQTQQAAQGPQEVLYASRRPIGYDDSLSPWENAWRRLSPAERAWKWTP